MHSLDNLHDTHYRFAFLSPRAREFMPFAVALVLLWELAFPLAIFSKFARRIILTAGVFFHVGTLLLLNVFFPFHLAMYLVFIDWPALTRKLERFNWFGRARAAWRGFRKAGDSSTDGDWSSTSTQSHTTLLGALLESKPIRPLAWLFGRTASRRDKD
jgi:hypothetical protein